MKFVQLTNLSSILNFMFFHFEYKFITLLNKQIKYNLFLRSAKIIDFTDV